MRAALYQVDMILNKLGRYRKGDIIKACDINHVIVCLAARILDDPHSYDPDCV